MRLHAASLALLLIAGQAAAFPTFIPQATLANTDLVVKSITGDGSGLTNIQAAASNTALSTFTVVGNAFSVGTSTLVVTSGSVGIGGTPGVGVLLDVQGASQFGGAAKAAIDAVGNLTLPSAASINVQANGNYTGPGDVHVLAGGSGILYLGTFGGGGGLQIPRSGGSVNNIGLNTTTPATLLDVNGLSTFRGNMNLIGSAATITTQSSVTASSFWGDGSHLSTAPFGTFMKMSFVSGNTGTNNAFTGCFTSSTGTFSNTGANVRVSVYLLGRVAAAGDAMLLMLLKDGVNIHPGNQVDLLRITQPTASFSTVGFASYIIPATPGSHSYCIGGWSNFGGAWTDDDWYYTIEDHQ